MNTNLLKGNIGEWSEIYAFLKLLGEGKVYAGDQNLERIKNLVYPSFMSYIPFLQIHGQWLTCPRGVHLL